MASQDTGSVASSVSIVVGAGSRNETMATAGLARCLEQIAFASTEKQTAFKILREAEAASVSYSASGDRGSLSYNATFPRGTNDAVSTLTECVTGMTPSVATCVSVWPVYVCKFCPPLRPRNIEYF